MFSFCRYVQQVVHIESLKARAARFSIPASPLAPALMKALEDRGNGKFYLHQAQAIDAALSGNHVAVCTSTASGKSLCYNVPILQVLHVC